MANKTRRNRRVDVDPFAAPDVRQPASSSVASELYSAVKRLGECELRGGGPHYAAIYCVTKNIVFCGAAGMGSTYWRLRKDDVEIALATGARRTELGPEWVEITLFQANWPKPDLPHWALRAYDNARTVK